MKTKAVLYLRTASVEQTGHNTIKSQKKELKEYCRLNNIKIKGVFEDCGASGSNFNRKGWKKLIRSIKKSKGEVNYILGTTPDRFSRNFGELIKMLGVLSKLKTDLKYIRYNKTIINY